MRSRFEFRHIKLHGDGVGPGMRETTLYVCYAPEVNESGLHTPLCRIKVEGVFIRNDMRPATPNQRSICHLNNEGKMLEIGGQPTS